MNSLLLSILLISISGLAAASDRSTEVDTPGDKPRVEATERIAVSPGLENTDWQLRQYLGDTGELKPVLGATTIDARFSQGEIGGSAGCNRYFGHYTGGQDHSIAAWRLEPLPLQEAGSVRMPRRSASALISLEEARPTTRGRRCSVTGMIS